MLTIVPTYQRVSLCKKMLESFKTTSTTDIIFGLSSNDKYLFEYIELFKTFKVGYYISNSNYISAIYNEIFSLNSNHDYYHMSSDDVIYKTIGWDIKLQSSGVAYGDDKLQGINLCTFPVINGNIVRKIGWIMLPALKRLYGDAIWEIIGTQINKYYYFPNVVIEHHHFINGMRENDTPSYNEDFIYDRKQFIYWILNDELKILNKIDSI
jgi:hypothetical protein